MEWGSGSRSYPTPAVMCERLEAYDLRWPVNDDAAEVNRVGRGASILTVLRVGSTAVTGRGRGVRGARPNHAEQERGIRIGGCDD